MAYNAEYALQAQNVQQRVIQLNGQINNVPDSEYARIAPIAGLPSKDDLIWEGVQISQAATQAMQNYNDVEGGTFMGTAGAFWQGVRPEDLNARLIAFEDKCAKLFSNVTAIMPIQPAGNVSEGDWTAPAGEWVESMENSIKLDFGWLIWILAGVFVLLLLLR